MLKVLFITISMFITNIHNHVHNHVHNQLFMKDPQISVRSSTGLTCTDNATECKEYNCFHGIETIENSVNNIRK